VTFMGYIFSACVFHHGLHTHASSVGVSGKVLDARTAETADGVGASRIGATRLTQALVDV
jgi:hypothetical protein